MICRGGHGGIEACLPRILRRTIPATSHLKVKLFGKGAEETPEAW